MKIILIILFIVLIIGWILFRDTARNRFRRFGQGKTIAGSISGKLEALDKTIGVTEPVCPYCGKDLENKISSRKECKHCGKVIYRRKRPYDKKDIWITESQLTEVEEQWAIVNGEHEEYLREKKRKQKIAKRLKEQQGSVPSREMIELQVMKEQAEEFERKKQMGLARNKRMEIAEYFEECSRPEEALQAYFEVCFLDANGPRNVGDVAGSERPPSFSLDVALVSPGVIKRIANLVEKLEYSPEKIKEEYFEAAHNTEQRLNEVALQKSPPEAWNEFKQMFGTKSR